MGLLDSVGNFFFGEDPERYDPDSIQAIRARQLGGPQHGYDVTGRTAAAPDLTDYAQTRGQQRGVTTDLAEQAAGRGPSAAVMAGNAARDANLTQTAALTAGRRGQAAATGIRAAGNQATVGNQQAAQNEAIAHANEMATARGQQVGLLGQLQSGELNAAGINQANAQFNAGLAQQAALQNQQAQLGIANTELGQRARQEGLSYSNLKPGSAGLLSPSNVTAGIGAGLTAISDEEAKSDRHRVDGSYGRALSPRDAKRDIRPVTMGLPELAGGNGGVPIYQPAGVIGPNSRVTPNWYVNSPAPIGNALGGILSNALLDYALERKSGKEKGEGYKAFIEAEHRGVPGASALLGVPGRQSPRPPVVVNVGRPGSADVPITSPRQVMDDGTALSDRQAKDDLRPASRAGAREMFEEAPAYSYTYKEGARDVGAPAGRQVSVMWDDLQRTPLGRKMDGGREPETGYHTVNYLKGLPAAFASLSDLNARMARLEDRSKPSKGGR